MKKLSLLILMCLNITIVNSQEFLECKVKDDTDNQGLYLTNIFLPEYNIGTSTNEKGVFRLRIDNKAKCDTVLISYLGYETKTFTISSLISKDEVRLRPLSSNLNTVDVVHKKAKINAKKLAQKAIALYSKQRPSFTHVANCQAAEYIKINGDYSFFMESVGYAIYAGDKITNNPLVRLKFFADNTCLANRNKQNLERAMKKAGNDIGLQSNLSAGLRSLQILNNYGVLNPIKARKYKFRIDSVYKKKQDYYYSIAFQKGEQKGKLLIQRENLSLVSVEQESDNCWSTVKGKNVKANEYFEFAYFMNRPFFSTIRCVINRGKVKQEVRIINKSQKASEFELDEQIWNLNAYDINPFINYNSKVWDARHSLFENEMDEIKRDLIKEDSDQRTLKMQYINNGEKWFSSNNKSNIKSGEKAIVFINELFSYF